MGRLPSPKNEEIKNMLNNNFPVTYIADKMQVTRQHVYNVKNNLKSNDIKRWKTYKIGSVIVKLTFQFDSGSLEYQQKLVRMIGNFFRFLSGLEDE